MDSSGDDEAILLDRYHYVALWTAGQYSSRKSLAAEWDDVHADALIGVLDAIRHFDYSRGAAALKAYVFIRARGAAIDGIRRRNYVSRRSGDRSRRVPLSLDLLREDVVGDVESPWEPGVIDRGYVRIEAAEAVRLLLVRLSRRHRFVIEAHHLAGRSLADIARELGVTESRVCQINVQALRQMRAMLAE